MRNPKLLKTSSICLSAIGWDVRGDLAFKEGEVRFSEWQRLIQVLPKPVRTGEVTSGSATEEGHRSCSLNIIMSKCGFEFLFLCWIWLVFASLSSSAVFRVRSGLPLSLLSSRLNRHWLGPQCFYYNSRLEPFNIRGPTVSNLDPPARCYVLHFSLITLWSPFMLHLKCIDVGQVFVWRGEWF